MRSDPVAYARSLGVQMGEGTMIYGPSLEMFGTEPYLIRLGRHCVIAEGVRFLTHDGAVWVFWESEPDLDIVAPITIGDNVFLGLNVMIMPGVEIGDNVIIGAGAIVTKSVPAGSVVAGSPARVICTIEEYRAKVSDRMIPIHRLPPAEKKRAIRDKYAAWLNA
jgi:acetyltransferase-like isoleucine patch superfamily enzyme